MDAHTVTRPVTADSPNVVVMPPLIFFLCLVGGGGLELLRPWQLPVPFFWHLFPGLLLAGVAWRFMMQGHGLFGRLGVDVRTNRPATRLVCQGAYRYSRNPMYTGMVGLLLGVGLAAGSAWMLLAVLPFGLYLNFFVVPREEAYLRRTFGEAYVAYCRQVRRWL